MVWLALIKDYSPLYEADNVKQIAYFWLHTISLALLNQIKDRRHFLPALSDVDSSQEGSSGVRSSVGGNINLTKPFTKPPARTYMTAGIKGTIQGNGVAFSACFCSGHIFTKNSQKCIHSWQCPGFLDKNVQGTQQILKECCEMSNV